MIEGPARRWGVILDWGGELKAGLREELTTEQQSEGGKEGSHSGIRGESLSGRGFLTWLRL